MKKVFGSYKYFFIGVISAGLLLFSACREKTHTAEKNETPLKETWTCSMHPEILRDQPGNCPICGMVLVKQIRKASVIREIRLEELLRPSDEFVISSIPVTTISVKTVSPEIEAFGKISYDTRQINTISARVSGRITKIYVHYRYQHIMKGDRILDIYSPELQTAQEELLFLLKNDAENKSLIEAAIRKIQLLGMHEGELKQVMETKKPVSSVAVYSGYSGHLHEAGNSMPGSGETPMNASVTEELQVKEGMYLQSGQVMFQVFNTDESWVLLNIFPGSQNKIKAGNPVYVIPETAPEKAFHARIDFVEPFFRDKNQTFMARVHFNNSGLRIPVGSQVRAKITGDSLHGNWLPSESVLSLGLQQVVFLRSDEGFIVHQVKTGFTYGNQIQILNGLAFGDSVAGNAQYLADSEGFIKSNHQP